MNESALWLTPIAVLAVMLLVFFVGCNELLDLDKTTPFDEDYKGQVADDAPTAWWRLQTETRRRISGSF